MRRIRLHNCIIVAVISLIATVAIGSAPQLINYQGRLTDGDGNPLDGDFQMVFSIYDDPVDGAVIWTETHPSVTVTDGLFSVLLGSVAQLDESAFSDALRYLGVKVDSDPELTPRTRITATAYAFQANRTLKPQTKEAKGLQKMNLNETNQPVTADSKGGLLSEIRGLMLNHFNGHDLTILIPTNRPNNRKRGIKS